MLCYRGRAVANVGKIVAQPHCLYFLCTEAIQYVYTILAVKDLLTLKDFNAAIILIVSHVATSACGKGSTYSKHYVNADTSLSSTMWQHPISSASS